jgi:hypothetical protein
LIKAWKRNEKTRRLLTSTSIAALLRRFSHSRTRFIVIRATRDEELPLDVTRILPPSRYDARAQL